MGIIVILLLLSLIIAGIIYFSIETLEQLLNRNIMRYIIIILLIIFIALYAFIDISGYNKWEEMIEIIVIFSIELFLIIFSFIEKLYK